MNQMSNTPNPFFSRRTTPRGTTPFHLIKNEHYEPAMLEGMRIQKEEIGQITASQDIPNFENTILALEKSGQLLDEVTTVFSNIRSAETNDGLQSIAQKMIPILSEHENSIMLDKKLFERVKYVFDHRNNNVLTPEQEKLLEDTYDSFIRNGANLNDQDKEKFKAITSELSSLSLQYSENDLKETNNYTLNITDQKQLAGLPDSAIEAAAQTAKEKGMSGWTFTLHAPSYVPFMTYAQNRALRQQLYTAFNTICTHDNEYNNLEIVKRIVNLHVDLAKLLGYNTYADYTLERRMAEKSSHVYELLNKLLEAYKPTALKECREVEQFAQEEEGPSFQVMPWDWSYYSNKLKDHKFSINEELLRPYFELEKVKTGVFGLAQRLYGIQFKENKDIPVYHKDVKAYEVFDKDGTYLAVLYTDFYPREGKRSGAWMTEYKGQWIDEKTGENSRPHVSIVMNFTKPTATKPALLTHDEVETFLHEFGHSLHGMFSNTTYKSLSGTNVYWDFVELPSQIMENFSTEKDFLNTFAKHYQTGENIPEQLITNLKNASNFNAAYACLRQLSFGFLDMAWYDRDTHFDGDVKAYEQEAWSKTQLLPRIPETCMSVRFGHIFAGGYSAGYYSYKWAEVLDADAFSMFKEQGLFSTEVAESFRENILSKGGTEHPMTLYKRFRKQEPTINALLKRNNIIN